MENFLSKRCWEIVKILLNTENPITINSVAEKLDVSNKTIRNDLKKLESYLKENDFGEIIKKPRIGIWLEVNEEQKNLLKNIVNRKKVYIQPFSTRERKIYIIKILLQAEGFITMQKLADDLYVSKATIYKDLEEVERWLKKYDLELKRRQNHGIEVKGDERHWRKALAELVITFKNSLQNRNTQIQTSRNFRLKELFPKINIDKIETILKEVEVNTNFGLADIAYEGFLSHIAISIERLRQNKDIEMNSKQLVAIKGKKEFDIAKLIAKGLEREFEIKVSEDEIGYIALHVLGAKVRQNYKTDNAEEILKNIDPKIINLALEIITLIGNILSVDLTKDEKLLVGLVMHLKPTINRLKYGLSLRNPILDEIKNNYPSVFGASWATSVLFEKYFGVKVNEEEIAYIAIHIGAALERVDTRTRAVIVCGSGIGTAQLVNIRLQKAISNLEIVNVISSNDIDKMKKSDFDIIITTIPIDYSLKPIIQINPIVVQRDIDRIKKYIKNIENTKKFHDNIQQSERIEGLFSEKLIYTRINANNKEEVIEKLGKKLVDNGYVYEKFIDAAIERENITSTAVGKGVAIPHGIHGYVKKPVIAIATLEKSIDWDGNQVDIVFLLALEFDSGNVTRDFFKKFYSMLDNEDILQRIRESLINEEIFEILIEIG